MEPSPLRPPVQEWAQRSIRRIAERHTRLPVRASRRLLVVHLDGVPHAVLQRAIHEGRMPFLTRRVLGGSYRLDSAFWGTPASTPCFQAGLLYGLRHPDLPAYEWFDRREGRRLKMNHPRDALAVEARLAGASAGLLGDGGTSYLSIFHGGAGNEVCMSSLASWKSLARAAREELRGLRAPRRHGVLDYLRSLVRETWDSAVEISRWTRRVRDWRHERLFFVNRLLLLRLGWELSHSRALIDLWKGVPAIYLVYSNYDEVAHRRGPLSGQALRELYRVDRALEELDAMARLVPEPYDVYFVTDHGHVDSVPFERRGGESLERLLLDGPPLDLEPTLARALQGEGRPRREPYAAVGDPVVVEAGNFAHVYLSKGEALDAYDVVEHHPHVLARALSSKDVGIVVVRKGEGALAIIEGGLYGPLDVHRAPLPEAFSRRALADYLRELPYLRTAGDLVLYGQATHASGTVGFAWEFGSHGGLTHTETLSSILWPSDAPASFKGLGHSTELHQKLAGIYRS